MIMLRRSADRGHFDHGWLDTYHTFSFGDYLDPRQMGFRTLRVINEDRVKPGAGFGMHGHRDMEIITLVLAGQLEHKDSLGTGSIIRPGELQRMTAGTGIMHSEFNPSPTEPVHLLQIWVMPRKRGLKPEYEQRPFPPAGRAGRWQLVASEDGRDGSLTIHQNARMALASLAEGQTLDYEFAPGRYGWLQVIYGEINADDETLAAGDGAGLIEESKLHLTARQASDVLLFDLG
jgi:quercetin 2,3-dioxygenase